LEFVESNGITLTELEAFARSRQSDLALLGRHRKTRALRRQMVRAANARWGRHREFLDKPLPSEQALADAEAMGVQEFDLPSTVVEVGEVKSVKAAPSDVLDALLLGGGDE